MKAHKNTREGKGATTSAVKSDMITAVYILPGFVSLFFYRRPAALSYADTSPRCKCATGTWRAEWELPLQSNSVGHGCREELHFWALKGKLPRSFHSITSLMTLFCFTGGCKGLGPCLDGSSGQRLPWKNRKKREPLKTQSQCFLFNLNYSSLKAYAKPQRD